MPELHINRGTVIFDGSNNDDFVLLGSTHRPPPTAVGPTRFRYALERNRLDAERREDLARYEQSLKYDAEVEAAYQRQQRKLTKKRPVINWPSTKEK